MSVDPRARGPRTARVPAGVRRHGHRPTRTLRVPGTDDRGAETFRAGGMTGLVDHVLGLLRDRRHPLESGVVRSVIDRLRHLAHDAPDPALRAAVHVGCAHLSAGNIDDAQEALTTAADILGRPAR